MEIKLSARSESLVTALAEHLNKSRVEVIEEAILNLYEDKLGGEPDFDAVSPPKPLIEVMSEHGLLD